MEYEFSFGTFRAELKIMTVHIQIVRCSWKFPAGTDPKSRVPFTSQPVLSFSGWDLYVVNF